MEQFQQSIRKVRGQRLQTPLRIAAETGDVATVRRLLSVGSLVPVISEMRSAVIYDYPDIVELFLEARAVDIDARDSDGKTCLAFSIQHPSIVKMLLERGANTELRAPDGSTPLHSAIKGQHTESAILLLKSGANAETEDYENRNPIDIALLNPSPGVESIALVKALLEHGCHIGRNDISKWRTVLTGSHTDVVVITETYHPTPPLSEEGSYSVASSSAVAGKDQGGPDCPAKPSIAIELVNEAPNVPCFTSSDGEEAPEIRRLWY